MEAQVIPLAPNRAAATNYSICRVCRRDLDRCTCFTGPVSVDRHRELTAALDAQVEADRCEFAAVFCAIIGALLLGFVFGLSIGVVLR